MRREFYVHHPEGEFILSAYEGIGITINNPGQRRSMAKALFQKSKGDIDVCMTDNGVVYILAQTYSGVIVKIVRSLGVWHRFDVLVPRKSIYYPKKFSLNAVGNEVYGCFPIKDTQKNALCILKLSKSGEMPSVLSYIRDFNSFDVCCSRSGIICIVFEDDKGRLCAIIYDTKTNKSTTIHLLEGGGFYKISVRSDEYAFHIVFWRAGSIFYIEVDAKARQIRSIYDAGSADEKMEILSSIVREKFAIDIISKEEVQSIEFNLKTGIRRKLNKEVHKSEVYEIKHVYECESEFELIL